MEWTRGYHRGAPRGVRRGEYSGVCCRDLPADGRIARYPSQEVEQDRGVIVACQGVVELHEIRHRKWSSAVTVTAACQGVLELHGICRRKWSRIAVAAVSRLGVQIRRLKFDSGRS